MSGVEPALITAIAGSVGTGATVMEKLKPAPAQVLPAGGGQSPGIPRADNSFAPMAPQRMPSSPMQVTSAPQLSSPAPQSNDLLQILAQLSRQG